MVLVKLTSIYTLQRWNLDTTTERKISIINQSKYTQFHFLTNYQKLKKEISPVPSKFIKDLIDSISLGLIDKTDSLLKDLSSGELANIIEQLDSNDRKKLIFFLGSSIAPEIILELDKDIRNEIISIVGEHTFLNIISKLDTDDLIIVLEEFTEDKRGQYLKLLPKKSQRELVKKGLKFPKFRQFDKRGRKII